MKVARLVVPAVVAALAVAGVASAAHSKASALPTTRIGVSATEYSFKLTKTKVPKGKIVFTIKNVGSEVHDFRVNGFPKSKFITGGASTTLALKITKPGTYQYVCTIGEHGFKGMRGILTVK